MMTETFIDAIDAKFSSAFIAQKNPSLSQCILKKVK